MSFSFGSDSDSHQTNDAEICHDEGDEADIEQDDGRDNQTTVRQVLLVDDDQDAAHKSYWISSQSRTPNPKIWF